jgi:comEA protein
MRITRAEKCIIVFTLLFAVFTVGVHLGTRRSRQEIVFSSAETAVTEPEKTPASAAESGAGTAASPERGASESININTATAAELQALDGIGEKLSQRIVDYREKNGPFESTEDIMNVSGIGSGIYARICGDITTGQEGAN